ncbi:pyridoxal phosphate-dependent aminotransferase [Pantoea cypripedii]|uniref:Aminotransferase n=1 Tax=Pantoea cypripedii TaxID=55209 RepID=A0A1X1EM28_PANCY|nr:pyridoxal phosphate-dependent aminotransferase [Pantoea cypripedii]MBP2199160.1 aspartate aminotransferase [Pantoea cypripedii]ORM90010.1 aspartate aminotransferase [Pantoea cypripedii]
METQQLNRYLERGKPSATYRIMDKVAELKAQGRTIISLSTGEPDFPTPKHICAAAIMAIQNGHTRYTQVAGLRALREAVAQKFLYDNALDVSWQETLICSGGKQVIYNALATTLNDGDEVIIPAPYWVSYPEMVQLCGGTPVTVACGQESGFKLTPALLQAAITPRTRWIILNSPSNPTGAVYSRDELRALGEVLRQYPRVLVLSDDIYEHLIFDDIEFATLAAVVPELKSRTLTMNGVSKAWAMTGWRIGFCAGPLWLINAMEKLQGQQTSGACSVSQYAALVALTGPRDFLTTSRQAFSTRRDMMVKMLNLATGLHCDIPQGAFYAFADCSGLIGRTSAGGQLLLSDENVATALLEEKGVSVVHGSAFGLGPYIRIAYAIDDASLEKACQLIIEFCAAVC